MKVCVLISTFDRYRALAEFTERRIRESWANVPEIHYAGLTRHPAGLELRDDPRNWMRVTRSACADLLKLGYEAAYVILDDHPPLGPCCERNLNRTLPAMMDQLGAVSLSLSGWGQGRARLGSRVDVDGFRLDRCGREVEWKYPLHPALWRLDALHEILDRLVGLLPEERQTPWAFERDGGNPDVDLPERLKVNCYRINGEAMASAPRDRRLKVMGFMTDVYRFGVRRLIGDPAREAVDERLLGVHHFYNGPYPLFWSGMVRKGKMNPNFEFYLKLTGQSHWLHDLKDFIREL